MTMGEARRKEMANEAPKLVATCPVCNKAYFIVPKVVVN